VIGDEQIKAVNEWYKAHLGFAENTKYFEPSTKDLMINYRVANLEVFVEQLKNEGVTIVDKIEDSDYGKFVHILDIEGNKFNYGSLWIENT